MRVLVARGRRVSLLLVQERSRGLLVHVGSRAVVTRARDRLGLPLMSRLEPRSDPIGGSKPFSETRDHILGLFT